ncbi:MAG TPA: hypothetical protein VG078_09135 [Acidimicrobiales bacterium]|nr:hypothetical protein [Acidimicrobiales bacterium]
MLTDPAEHADLHRVAGISVQRTGKWLSVGLEPGTRTKVLDVYVDDPCLAGRRAVPAVSPT